MVNRSLLPRDFSVESGDRHKYYKALVDEKTSPFYKLLMKDVFMYAMSIGFSKNKKKPLDGRLPVIPSRVFSNDELAIIQAVAISDTKNVEILYEENIRGIVLIAEEYANGGLDILYYQIFGDSVGDLERTMEQELRDYIDKNVVHLDKEEKLFEPPRDIFMDFENELRDFLITTLTQAYESLWWKTGVPPDVRNSCETRKEAEERLPWMTKSEYPLIYYADFNDYYKIISRKDNWRNIYAKYFIDQAWIKTKLTHELSPIRNSIAHNRELTHEDRQKLNFTTGELIQCIR